jgi:hypothetical protein
MDLATFSILLSSLWRSALVGRLGRGGEAMKITTIPSVQAAAMIYKGH